MVKQEFLDFLVSIYAVQVLLDIFLAFVLYRFYRTYGRRYLLPWALSWACPWRTASYNRARGISHYGVSLVIYMSGYTERDLLEGGMDNGDQLLQKPFTGEALRRRYGRR